MKTIETIRTFKTRRFTVRVTAVEDYDTDLSWDNDGSVRRGLESGELVAFAVNATVYFDGAKVGSDSLGGCIYKSTRDFMDHFGVAEQARKASEEYGKPVVVGSYFSDMVRTSIEEARKFIVSMKTVNVRN